MTSKCEKYGLFSSIKNVRINNCALKEGNKMRFLNERAFAYELYYQWNLHLPCKKLIVSAEVSKKINEQYVCKARRLFGKKTNRFQPDIVLHHSNEVNDDKEQKIICEIKVNKELTRKSLLRDLKKLIAYTDNQKKAILYNPFEIGVFILLDGDIAKIKRNIKGNDFSNEDISKIICVTVNINGESVNLNSKSLENILKDNK